MNANSMENTTWISAINPMLTMLGRDLHNHRQFADPWTRKAQSMAKAWTVILRYGRTLPTPRRRRQITTWESAVPAMLLALRQLAHMQRTHTGWKRWASSRALQVRRWPGKFRMTPHATSPDAGPVAIAGPTLTAA